MRIKLRRATSLCPSKSCTVRISVPPPANAWQTNAATHAASPACSTCARRAACRIACLKRRIQHMMPPPQSGARVRIHCREGKNHCHSHATPACGNFRSNALRQPHPRQPPPRDPPHATAAAVPDAPATAPATDSGNTVTRSLSALAPPHDHLPPLQIHVLDPQPQQLHQPQPAPIHQLRHQPRRALQRLKQPLDTPPGSAPPASAPVAAPA